MKKRLLALTLCLVMMTSLLPITAAADTYYLTSATIKASGVEQRSDGLYYVNITSAIGTYDGGEEWAEAIGETLSKLWYSTDTAYDGDSEILTLSTCMGGDQRLTVHAICVEHVPNGA